MVSRKQVLEVKADSNGRHYWHCDLQWWVPHKSIELTAQSFKKGTCITVTEPVVLELQKQSEDGKD